MRTKQLLLLVAAVLAVALTACGNQSQTAVAAEVTEIQSAVVTLPGTFTFNLPCQIKFIHPDKPGKAIMFVWLHGGVRDQKIHSFFKHPNHYDNCAADDSIINYLERKGIKAIALLPMCHKADLKHCVTWNECYEDVNQMIGDFIVQGLVDPSRIYLAGSSDGGRGVWDYAADHPDMFAAAISMSCSEPRVVSIPVYFFNTGDETDCTERVKELKTQGATLMEYRYCPNYDHGGDAALCDNDLLDRFFAHVKK